MGRDSPDQSLILPETVRRKPRPPRRTDDDVGSSSTTGTKRKAQNETSSNDGGEASKSSKRQHLEGPATSQRRGQGVAGDRGSLLQKLDAGTSLGAWKHATAIDVRCSLRPVGELRT
jgi:hypothetical protein